LSAETLMLVVFLGAFLAPVFSRALRMPVPVGELVFGLALGHILGFQELPQVVLFLSEFGFLLLMFLAGLEIDFNLLERIERRLLAVYLLYSVLVFLIASVGASLLGMPLAAALILSLISVGLMVATLRDMGAGGSGFGKRILILGVIGEIVSLFVLTFMEKVGNFHGWSRFLGEMAFIGLFFLAFFLFLYAVKLLVWWFPELVKKLTHEEDPSAIGIRLSLFLMFTASVLAHLVGMESVLGAFLAGMMFAFFIRKKHDLEEKLSSIGYGFLIPIFFIKTGMTMDLPPLGSEVVRDVLILLAFMLGVRLAPSLLLLAGGFSLREAFLSSVMLAYPFTLLIAGTGIALSSGLVDGQTGAKLLISAVLSSLLFPWASKLLVRILR